MDARAQTETITAEVSAGLADSGVVVENVAIQQAGKRRRVRVTVARDLGNLAADDHTSTVEPLTLDEIAEATRTVNDVLDTSDLMGQGSYTLEVSSAGVDQPLTTPEQFRRNVGRLVRVVTTEGGEGPTGRLTASGPEGITLSRDGNTSSVPWGQVTRATVQVEFARNDGEDL